MTTTTQIPVEEFEKLAREWGIHEGLFMECLPRLFSRAGFSMEEARELFAAFQGSIGEVRGATGLVVSRLNPEYAKDVPGIMNILDTSSAVSGAEEVVGFCLRHASEYSFWIGWKKVKEERSLRDYVTSVLRSLKNDKVLSCPPSTRYYFTPASSKT